MKKRNRRLERALRLCESLTMRVSDHEHIRLRVLKAILRSEPLARSQLTAETGLAAGTVSQITNDLLRRRMIVEERVATRVGRPRINLGINPTGAHAMAAVLMVDGTLAVQIVNLRGDPVASFDGRVNATSYPGLAEQIADQIGRALDAGPVDRDGIRHVGVGLPALVDSRAGIIRWLQTFEGRDYPLASEIGAHLALPITIDNSSNLLARAEHWFGRSDRADSFSMIVIGLGISSARYVNGMLWAGANGLTPEFGHVKVRRGAERPCTCGAKGCIDAYASLWGLTRQLHELRDDLSPADLAADLADLNVDTTATSSAGRRIIRQAAGLLGTAISNHINTADPGRVLIVTDERIPADTMIPEVIRVIERDTLPAILEQTKIEVRSDDKSASSRGAAAVVLEQMYMRV